MRHSFGRTTLATVVAVALNAAAAAAQTTLTLSADIASPGDNLTGHAIAQ